MASTQEPLRFHRKIYPARAIRETAKAFAELVEADVSSQGEYHLVSLRLLDKEHSLATLRHEFANYALGRAARRR